jgi:ERCC4-related helicase
MKENIDTYTQVILGTAVKDNTLLIYPVSFEINPILEVLIKYFLRKDDSKKVAIILNKSETWNQISKLKDELEEYELNHIISTQSIEKRTNQYDKSQIIATTPQLLRNDILRQIISPADFQVLIFFDAHLTKGKHASVQLMEVFLNNKIFIRNIGLTRFIFQNPDSLIEVCENLLVTKIEYIEPSSQPFDHSFSSREDVITVPINKDMYNFCFEVNRFIREYQNFLKAKGVERPLSVRKDFRSFVQGLKSKYEFDEQQVLTRKAIELINFLSIKELVEASGPKAALEYMKKLRKREKDNSKKNGKKISSFARTPVFEEIFENLVNLSNASKHPKFDRINQLISQMKSKLNYKKFYIIANHKSILSQLPGILQEIGLRSKILPRSQSKERTKLKQIFDSGEIDVILASHYVKTEADAIIFFNTPTKYETFLEARSNQSKIYFLVTHRSQEERVFHKYRNREKSVLKIIKDERVQQKLVQNQQVIFNKNVEDKMNSRTKAFVNLAKSLSDNRRDQINVQSPQTEINDRKTSYIQFLANCSYQEAVSIAELLDEKEMDHINQLSINELIEIFSKERAKAIFNNLEGRRNLVPN